MAETINQRRADAIRSATYGQEVREPIARALEVNRDRLSSKVSEIDAKHKKRVTGVSTSEIAGKAGYYTLSFTRANGQ